VVEWVEVRGKSIDVAVAAAMNELGVADRSQVDVEVVQEPERGFLGLGGRDAIVRVKPKPAGRDRRGRGSRERRPRTGNGNRSASAPQGNRPQSAGGNRSGGRPSGRPAGQGRGGNPSRTSGGARRSESRPSERRPERPLVEVDPATQAPAVDAFLTGLVEAFGLEGTVNVSISEDVIVATIEGEQTEALVGNRGSVMEAIHEVTKTSLHRQFRDTARVRIDIAGYAERRRQALSIYAGQLIAQVQGEGGEIMLEPMSAADRKVIHDAVAAVDGVRSYSEGEPPRRYVVISATDDFDDQPDDSPASDEVGGDDLPEDDFDPES
jgi:spoIIIJ-associated protein